MYLFTWDKKSELPSTGSLPLLLALARSEARNYELIPFQIYKCHRNLVTWAVSTASHGLH